MDPFSLLLASLLLGITLFAASLLLPRALLEGSKRWRRSAKPDRHRVAGRAEER
jgi:hypothetical protein